MMNTMKKIAAFLLAAIMLLSLAACGGGGGASAEVPTEADGRTAITKILRLKLLCRVLGMRHI